MKKIGSTIVNQHIVLTRYALIVLVMGLVTLLFTQKKFNYDYELGKPWRYEALLAPFTFSIQKSNAELELEKQAIRDNFIAYYQFNKKDEELVKQEFQTFYNIKWSEEMLDSNFVLNTDSSLHYKKGLNILLRLNQQGIIEPVELDIGKFNKDVFYRIENNEIGLFPFADFHDIRTAYQTIIEEVQENRDLNVEFMITTLQEFVTPNMTYDKERSDKILEEALGKVLPTRGVIQEGENIISDGEIVNEEKYLQIKSLQDQLDRSKESGNSWFVNRFGYLLITTIVFSLFFFYMRNFHEHVYRSLRQYSFVLAVIIIFLFVIRSVLTFDQILLLYFIPFCIVPIILRMFFGDQLALFSYLILLIMTSLIISYDFEFIILQLIAGIVAIIIGKRSYYWSQFFIAAAAILLVYIVSYFAFTLIHTGKDLIIDWKIVGALCVNALLTLLAFPLIPVFERIFGLISDITLVELSDFNKPLLKELGQKAPGTFWHSIQVSNLAESVAQEIGANSLLTKVGSLYHDIGKIDNPAFFIENQKSDVNPHDNISPDQSAKIIIGHVIKGIEMAKSHRLPNIITDFIRTHHGTTTTFYFLNKYKENADDFDIRDFTYPGPLPYSKETAIVMMADSIEAASKSLNNPSAENIDLLVDKIVEDKIKQEQFVRSDISYKDISTAKKVFKKLLKGKFHIRISYPSEN